MSLRGRLGDRTPYPTAVPGPPAPRTGPVARSSASPRSTPPTATCSTRPGPAPPDGLVAVADHQTAGRGRLDRTLGGAAGVVAAGVGAGPAGAAGDGRARAVMAAALALADAVGGGRRGRRRAQVAQRPRGRRPQARRAPGRARRRRPGGRRRLQRRAGRRSRPSSRRPRPRATSRPVATSTATRCSTAFLDAARARARRARRRRRASTGRGSRRSGGACASSTCAATISSATAVDVTDDGALVVRDDDGVDDVVTAGDVVHLRPELTRRTPVLASPTSDIAGSATPKRAASGVEVAGDEGGEGVGERGGDRAGRRAGSAWPSTVGDRLHLADGRREERLVGVARARRSGAADFVDTRCRARRRARARARASTPSRQPRRPRRRAQHAVVHDEHVRARGLAQLVAGVGEDRFARAVLAARTRARARSRRTRSSSAPRSRRARCAPTARRRPRSTAATDATSLAATITVGRRVAAARSRAAATPPVTVMREPRLGEPVRPAAPRRPRRAAARGRARSSPSPAAECASRSRWRRHANGRRRRRGWSRTRRRRRAARGRTATRARRRRRAASRRSTHDASAPLTTRTSVRAGARDREEPRRLELGLGPLGVGLRVGDDAARRRRAAVRSPCRHGERADGDGEVAVAACRCRSSRTRRSRRRAAPARGLRWPGARVASGAPVTDAGGNVAAHERAECRRRRAACRAPCSRGGAGRGAPRPRTAPARGSTRARTRARGRCGRGRRSSRSRRGPWRWRAARRGVGAGALDRPGLDSRARATQEALGRRRHDRDRPPRTGEAQQRRCAAPGGVPASAAYSATGSSARSQREPRVRFTW